MKGKKTEVIPSIKEHREKSFKKKTTPRIKVIHKEKVLYKKRFAHAFIRLS